MKKQGFTLIELVITIAIIGILMLLGIPAISTYMQNGGNSACKNQRAAIEKDYRFEVNMNPSLSIQSLIDEVAVTVQCPNGGVYSASEDGKYVICSIHGKTGQNPAPSATIKPTQSPSDPVCGPNASAQNGACLCNPGYAGDPLVGCTLSCRPDQVVTNNGCACPVGFVDINGRCQKENPNSEFEDKRHDNIIKFEFAYSDVIKAYEAFVADGNNPNDFVYNIPYGTLINSDSGKYVASGNPNTVITKEDIAKNLYQIKGFTLIQEEAQVKNPEDIIRPNEDVNYYEWNTEVVAGQMILDGKNYYIVTETLKKDDVIIFDLWYTGKLILVDSTAWVKKGA